MYVPLILTSAVKLTSGALKWTGLMRLDKIWNSAKGNGASEHARIITPETLASILTRLPCPLLDTLDPSIITDNVVLPLLHTQDPGIITDNVTLPYASHPRPWHHYWQCCPSLCFTPKTLVSLLTMLLFPLLHTLDPCIITDNVALPFASHPRPWHQYWQCWPSLCFTP